MSVKADERGMAKKAAGAVQLAINYGWLTNTNVAAANTVAGLRAAVTAATGEADAAIGLKDDIDRAIRVLGDLGVLTDANILSLTTTAGLMALIEDAEEWAMPMQG